MKSTVNINNVFHTWQGEGANAGRRALFIRMPYCNLKCSWCDTEYNSHITWDMRDLYSRVVHDPCRFAVITGGEPMMNKDTPHIVAFLKQHGFEVACETNGTFPIVDGIDFVTCSPKRFQENPYAVHPEVWPKVSEFKYVVDDEFDFAILKRHTLDDGKRYSLSPEFNNMKASMERIFAYTKENPQWRISLQTHKWINVP